MLTKTHPNQNPCWQRNPEFFTESERAEIIRNKRRPFNVLNVPKKRPVTGEQWADRAYIEYLEEEIIRLEKILNEH